MINLCREVNAVAKLFILESRQLLGKHYFEISYSFNYNSN